MGYGAKLEVWGGYASFNRPEMKVERVSYDVITPSAARGILEAIYWKPQIRWVVDCIRVLKPIRFTHVRRNEIDQKIPSGLVKGAMKQGQGPLGIAVEEHRQQRAARILRDVCYGIEAHVEVLDPADRDGKVVGHPGAKHLEAFKRRAGRGQYFHHPYLGCREFPANFRLLGEDELFPECPAELRGERDLGYMLWDMVFKEDPVGNVVERHRGRRLLVEPRFFRACMADGVIEVPPLADTRG